MDDVKGVDVDALRELAERCGEVADADGIITCHYLAGDPDTDCKGCRYNDKERCLPKVFADIAERIRKAIGEPGEQVLAADGLPIVVGETVYDTMSGEPYEVAALIPPCGVALRREDCTARGLSSSLVTHTQPDTQERIDNGIEEDFITYWDCEGKTCEGCDVINGESPSEHYGVDGCRCAKFHDLLRRQRELDARLMGGE